MCSERDVGRTPHGDSALPSVGRLTDDSQAGRLLRRYRRFCLLMGLLLVISWGIGGAFCISRITRNEVQARPSAVWDPPTEKVTIGQPGPWGQLTYFHIATEMPYSPFSPDQVNLQPPVWHFKNKDAGQLAEFLKSAGLTDEQLATLLDRQCWQVKDNGIRVSPRTDVILGMSPNARATIYTELERYADNINQRGPFKIRKEYLAERLEESHLDDRTKSLFTSMLYPRGPGLFCFANFNTALRQLSDDDMRGRFLKMVSRSETYLVKLMVRPDSDVESLVRYWGTGKRAKDVGTLINGAKRFPGGCNIDIAHLLPLMPRQHVYTFPRMTADKAFKYPNCSWTALNFFREIPDDSFKDPVVLTRELSEHYVPIPAPSQLGDLILLEDRIPGVPDQRTIFHVAVYIADDIVFTKNGGCFSQPWIFQRLSDLFETYAEHNQPDSPVDVIYARLKNDPGL